MMQTALVLFLSLTTCVLLGYGLLWWLVMRTTHDRQLSRIVLFSYQLRVLLAVLLYSISYFRLPVFHSLQVADGFWSFGLDSHVYHYFGVLIAEAWKHGVELPNPELGVEYFAVVAAIYRVLGACPLYPILFNCFLAAGNGLLAHLIISSYAGQRAGRVGAVLVGWWPSSFLWSAQLLKDSLSWFLLLATVWLVITLMPVEPSASSAHQKPVWRFVMLASIVTLLTRLRFYLGSALAISGATPLLYVGALTFRRRSVGGIIQGATLMLVIVGSVLLARTLNTLQLLSPAHPEVGHANLAIQFWRHNQRVEAEQEFWKAIALNHRYKDAYLGLASLLIQENKLDDAQRVYTTYLEVEDPEKRSVVKLIIARTYMESGNRALLSGRVEEAIAAYEGALTFHPGSVSAYTNLGITLAKQQKFALAIATLEKAAVLFDQAQSQKDHDATQRQTIQAALAQVRAEQERAQFTIRAAAASPSTSLPQLTTKQSASSNEVTLQSSPIIASVTANNSPPPTASSAEHPSSLSQPTTYHVTDTSEVRPPHSTLPTQAEHSNVSSDVLPIQQNWDAVIEMAFAVSPLSVRGAGRSHVRDDEVRATSFARGDPQSKLKQVTQSFGHLNDQVTEDRQPKLRQLPQSFRLLNDQALKVVSESRPEVLGSMRRGFVSSGGNSLMDGWAQISSLRKLLTYLPRALLVGFLAPFPWQWFDVKGSTGVMRVFAGLEMLLFYGLVPAILSGVWRGLRRHRTQTIFLMTLVLCSAMPIALVVANLGTLFRLRLLFFLPLLLIAAEGDFTVYRRIAQRCAAQFQGERDVPSALEATSFFG